MTIIELFFVYKILNFLFKKINYYKTETIQLNINKMIMFDDDSSLRVSFWFEGMMEAIHAKHSDVQIIFSFSILCTLI